jgi:hypothetical protein
LNKLLIKDLLHIAKNPSDSRRSERTKKECQTVSEYVPFKSVSKMLAVGYLTNMPPKLIQDLFELVSP